MTGSNIHRKRNKESGQVAILFALVFTFMFVLFAFVVDFGHLINAKINLQNAADAAAYSGAAQQAIALNRLGAINYRIRQDLKEMAMRVQVTHLRHNRNFPRQDSDLNGPPRTSSVEPFICQQAEGYRALNGRRYGNDTNLCRNASPSTGGLPPIVVPPVIANFDPVAVALTAQIRKIAEAADEECKAAAVDNQVLTNHLIAVYTARSRFHADEMHQVEQWLNSLGSGNAQGNQHQIALTASESAKRNLSLAAQDEFKIEIVQPAGNEYIRLREHPMRASLFYVNFNVVGSGCVGKPSFVDFEGMLAGVTKVPDIVTYFAVKLTSHPKLLFMPQAWLDADFPTLVAYAAAKPFGSRIGPNPAIDPLVPVPNRAGNTNRMINFSFRPGDNLGIMNTKMMALLDRLHPFNSASRPDGNEDTGWPDPPPYKTNPDLSMALRAIHAPTIFDALFYTVFPDPGGATLNNSYLKPEYAQVLFPDWLEASDAQGNLMPDRTPSGAPYMPMSGNKGQGWVRIDANNLPQDQNYANYALESPASHSIEIAPDNIPNVTSQNANEFGFATRDMVHSGWTPQNRPNDQRRIGYSVKFVGMDALLRTVVNDPDQGSAVIANRPTGDENITKIYH